MSLPLQRIFSASVLTLLGLGLVWALPALSQTAPDQRIFGPKQYLRTTGAPNQYTYTFAVPTSVDPPFLLRLVNGDADKDDGKDEDRDKDADKDRKNDKDKEKDRDEAGTPRVGKLSHARAGHTATLLADGTVLLTGGRDKHRDILDSAERWDPTTLQSTRLSAELTTPRTDHTATVLPTRETLLAAGRDRHGVLFSTELLTRDGAFAALPVALRILRAGHTATLLPDGRVLILGGVDASRLTLAQGERFEVDTGLLYNPRTGTFTLLPHALAVPRTEHTTTLLPSGLVLVVGGRNTDGVVGSAELVDPATGTSILLSSMLTTPRAGHTASLLNDGRVLLAGGTRHGDALASVEVFDPASQTFTPQRPNLRSARVNHTATALPTGEILIAGGQEEDDKEPTADTELYVQPGRDSAPPTVLDRQPASGATGVSRTPLIGIRFSEPINVTTLTASSLTLAGPGGPVAGTVSPGEEGLLAFFVPKDPLAQGTTYTLTLQGITDRAGNPLGTFTSRFTTVLTTPALSLAPTTATLRVGDSLTMTVTSAAPADVGGLTVTLSQSGTGSVTVPQTVLIPKGQSSATFTVTGATAGNVTLNASAPIRLPASSTLTITNPVPTITGFSPTSGRVGDLVTITGTNFTGASAVSFNGGLAATFSIAGTASIVATVPSNAMTGPITVTTSQGTATSAQPFTVTPRPDFTLSAVPAQATALQGGQTSYVLSVTGVGDFTGLVALGVSGLPSGVTGQFSRAFLSAGQSANLTLTTSGTTSTTPLSFTITGSATLDSGPRTQSLPLTLSVLAGGQTSLSGQFLRVDGTPIQGVQLTIGSAQAQTDAGGNFLFGGLPAGAQHMMVDANAAVAGYPIYAMDVTVTAGQPNVLVPIRITPPPPPERFTPINNATADQIITDPRFPGLEVRLPAGVTITGWDGNLKNKIAFERLNPDQIPVPPPPGGTRSLYQFFFGTPMGGQPSAPIPVTVPNDQNLEPGDQAQIWYYDASPFSNQAGWRLAGLGTVSEDGTKVIPNPGVGIQRFCGTCGLICILTNLFNGTTPSPPGHAKGGEPVDLVTGQMIVEKTDLVLPGRLPVTLSRTYNPSDVFGGNTFSGGIAGVNLDMGPGWALSVNTVLLPFGSGFALTLPGNGRMVLSGQPDGTFRNFDNPYLSGAALSALPSGGHQLRFKDGTTWKFRSIILGIEWLVEMTDRNGNGVTIERNSLWHISRIVDSAGRALEFSYSGSKISQIRDPLGRTVQYGYDGNGRLATVTDPAGGETRYTYDSAGRILTITDPKNIQFLQNFYGPSGRVLRQVQADGSEFRFRYQLSGANVTGLACGTSPSTPGTGGASPVGQTCPSEDSWENLQAGYTITGGLVVATTVVDPKGNATPNRFNGTGLTTAQTDALGQNTTTTRDGGNRVLSVSDPLGHKTSFTYDAAGNATTTKDDSGNTTTFAYEPTFNRLTRLTDAFGKATQFAYDTKGNLLTTTDPLNNSTAIAYNSFGQPTRVTDALGNPTTFEYDAAGNLTATTDPAGGRTTRVYDQVSRLIALTDPRGLTTQFTYDALNRVTQITDPLNGITQFSYDPNGNLLSVTDAKHQTTQYTYDAMDRLTARTDALGRQESYQYDPVGNLTQFTDRKNQTATFTHDSLNRRIGAAYADGSTTTFAYDAAGRLVTATDSLAGTIQFIYDTLNRLVQEITPQGAVTYTYDALGRRSAMGVNGQQPVTYTYDAASHLTQVAQGTQAVALTYDAAGRRSTLTYPNSTNTTYSYDVASRLTNILHQGPAGVIESLTYTYDAAGNRINLTRANAAATQLPQAVQAAYDAANEQLQFGGATQSLTYDQNGNLTNDGTNTYTWDARNRLTALSGPGVSGSFVYDALGRRTSKTINSVTTQFLYDGSDIVAEIGGGAVGATYLRSLRMDEPFVRQSSSNEYYHTDALGSVLVLTDQTGVAQTTYNYEAFGKTTITGTSANPFQYTGREDDGTGLFYYRARYYNPKLERFISQDPVGLFGGINSYSYVLSNPLKYIDNLGLKLVGPTGQQGEFGTLDFYVERVKRTPRGEELYNILDQSSITYTLRPRKPGDPCFNCIPADDPTTMIVDPNIHPLIQTTEGVKPASIERVIGHEMGHAATGAPDPPCALEAALPGPNVLKNENPVAEALGEPRRTRYRISRRKCP